MFKVNVPVQQNAKISNNITMRSATDVSKHSELKSHAKEISACLLTPLNRSGQEAMKTCLKQQTSSYLLQPTYNSYMIQSSPIPRIKF